ncbi:hypothetical protein NDU88_007337 [Pleurodeles waltl]|uniref:Uncharacterized protein n=1 Tax=Pleurodeles waltl TaxID=8319 RepID=A0AAV7NST3_PLEWA|nr:hypothetical protein NDU88_007337 [Pleurodeles waltl]
MHGPPSRRVFSGCCSCFSCSPARCGCDAGSRRCPRSRRAESAVPQAEPPVLREKTADVHLPRQNGMVAPVASSLAQLLAVSLVASQLLCGPPGLLLRCRRWRH